VFWCLFFENEHSSRSKVWKNSKNWQNLLLISSISVQVLTNILAKKVFFFTKILSYLPLALLSSYWQSRYSGYLIIRCWKFALYGFSVYKFQDLQNINISRHSIFFSGEKNLCRTMNKNVFRLLFNPEAMILSVYRSSY
jgi:hypothetical protein